jgi:hypothetical protein
MVVDEKQVDMLQSSRENGVGTRPHSKSIPAILGANLFKQHPDDKIVINDQDSWSPIVRRCCVGWGAVCRHLSVAPFGSRWGDRSNASAEQQCAGTA